jgi:hypothetical protein
MDQGDLIPMCFFFLISFSRSNNMLYPQEDKEMRTLHYACSACEHKVVVNSLAPFRMTISLVSVFGDCTFSKP